jgi:penicillin-binding protein 1C
VKISRSNLIKFFLIFLFAVLLLLPVLNRAFPPDLSKLHDPALLVLASDGTPAAALGSRDRFWRLPTTPGDVDPAFIAALIDTEDKNFWREPGVDPAALARAGWQDARARKIVSGGSTITMQVARLLTPHRRSFLGKFVEVARAVQLSAAFRRTQILSMYLTLAPYGGNIEGVQAASWLYFGHGAAHLSRPEIALLVALPRRPEALRPDRHPAAAIEAIARVYATNGFGPAPDLFANAIRRRQFDDDAPQAAAHLRALGLGGVVATSLDSGPQREVLGIAVAQAANAGGGADVAVLVLRNADARVLAYVGGVGASVDMIQAVRSPGSTLKPFIYGMAFDRGLATPATLIDDAPLANASYDPADFDRSWHGVVPVALALQQSYNLPAVKMLEAVGPRAAVSALRAAGADLVLPAGDDHPSLAVALGGVGIRLFDLASLYAGLSRPGQQFRAAMVNAESAPQAAVMSAPAARQILGILRGLPPPDGTSGFGGRAVAYKTGTSYGFRDAWSIGVSGDYTVGVWVGRPDGTPRPGCYGLNTAAPVMGDVFALLPADRLALPEPVTAADIGGGQGVQRLAGAGTLPKIVFPPAGAAIEAEAGNPMALSATGGAPPYRWIIDGVAQPAPPVGEDADWLPPSAGFFRITAIDGNGQYDSESVQVK